VPAYSVMLAEEIVTIRNAPARLAEGGRAAPIASPPRGCAAIPVAVGRRTESAELLAPAPERRSTPGARAASGGGHDASGIPEKASSAASPASSSVSTRKTSLLNAARDEVYARGAEAPQEPQEPKGTGTTRRRTRWARSVRTSPKAWHEVRQRHLRVESGPGIRSMRVIACAAGHV